MLRAAADLMHLRGVQGTSVDDVLVASGTGKSQFYRYFGSKGDLVRAVLQYQMQEWVKRSGPLLAHLDTWQGFETWFQRIVAFQSRRGFLGGCPVGSMAAEMADLEDTLRRDLVGAFKVRRGYVAQGLARMKERGDLVGSADPEKLSDFVIAAIQGALLLAATEKDSGVLKNTLDHVLAHLRSFATTRQA
ncbi:MAG: TetR/AcrR family transcriptional regulator [Acidobacteria bacterium]|nr:TetR/AcrR family transcriptional regulator [Acidobacteriota bacterium]